MYLCPTAKFIFPRNSILRNPLHAWIVICKSKSGKILAAAAAALGNLIGSKATQNQSEISIIKSKNYTPNTQQDSEPHHEDAKLRHFLLLSPRVEQNLDSLSLHLVELFPFFTNSWYFGAHVEVWVTSTKRVDSYITKTIMRTPCRTLP